jgi:hypothetical protein
METAKAIVRRVMQSLGLPYVDLLHQMAFGVVAGYFSLHDPTKRKIHCCQPIEDSQLIA